VRGPGGKGVVPVRADVRCSRNMSESFQRAVALIAKRWTPLILFVLSERPRRFNEIAERIEFVSDRMLSERLKELEREGLIERRIFAEVPVRVEYRLTEMGHELQPVFAALGQWAGKWLASPEGHPCPNGTPDATPDCAPSGAPSAEPLAGRA
jgi:DNA-binding HxlR family transcriptional regulator